MLGILAGGYAYTLSICLSDWTYSPSQDCAGVILFASDRAVEVANDAMQSLGGNGYINGTSLFSGLDFLSVANLVIP